MRRSLTFLLMIVIALAGVVAYLIGGSMPRLDGELALQGLDARATVTRDALGVPSVFATTREDLFHVQGVLHGQDRFFQMDLARRAAGGRLSELFGAIALNRDKAVRVHGLQQVADSALEDMTPDMRARLDAYVQGVNAGLFGLRVRPFEYLLLRTQPEPWTAVDSLLVALSMFLELNDEEAALDRQRGLMFETLPADVYDWLTTPGGSWDAPLVGPASEPPPMPAARWFDAPGSSRVSDDRTPGSNSFAVAGTRTPHGAAILANDMHLGHSIPNIWYRIRLVQQVDERIDMQAIGVSLPGLPGIVVGSNTHIAWGFTNSYGDYSDRVVLRMAEAPGRYRVPRGGDTLRVREERINVRDEPTVLLSVPMSRFGPVIAEDVQGRPVAVRWIAHYARALNLNLLDMLDVRDVDSGLALAQRLGIPPQNVLIAGRDGRIGWTIAGQIPRRVGYNPSRPQMSDHDAGWRGWLSPSEVPRYVDPPSGQLWTANGRVASLNDVARIGADDYPLGVRAAQIRQSLADRPTLGETDALAVQLDTRGQFIERWRVLMRSVLTPAAVADRDERRVALEMLSRGRLEASASSRAYRLVRAFRARVERDLMAQFLAPLAKRPDIRSDRLRQREYALWQTASEQPEHLVPLGAQSWEDYFLTIIDDLTGVPGQAGDELATWGDRNRLNMRHPLAGSLPLGLGRFLTMPDDPLPGDVFVPRVQAPSFGASQRLVVAPGHEDSGIFHMPGGQSGHPMSPFFDAGHEDWVTGRSSPLMPGPARYTLTLVPAQ